MKHNLLKVSLFFLLLSLTGTMCKDHELDLRCYKGKVVSLNQGDGCNNILEIVNTIDNNVFPLGTKITFDPKLFSKKLNRGDFVFFKIIQYEEWVGPSTANCLWPKYTAQIEPSNK